ncbi:hypothetical protein ES707_09027 [subsurface metagenome]
MKRRKVVAPLPWIHAVEGFFNNCRKCVAYRNSGQLFQGRCEGAPIRALADKKLEPAVQIESIRPGLRGFSRLRSDRTSLLCTGYVEWGDFVPQRLDFICFPPFEEPPFCFPVVLQFASFFLNVVIGKIPEIVTDEISPWNEVARCKHGFEEGVQSVGVKVRLQIVENLACYLFQIVLRDQPVIRIHRHKFRTRITPHEQRQRNRTKLQVFIDQDGEIWIVQNRDVDCGTVFEIQIILDLRIVVVSQPESAQGRLTTTIEFGHGCQPYRDIPGQFLRNLRFFPCEVGRDRISKQRIFHRGEIGKRSRVEISKVGSVAEGLDRVSLGVTIEAKYLSD